MTSFPTDTMAPASARTKPESKPHSNQQSNTQTKRNQGPAEHSLLKKGGPDDLLLSVYRKVEKRILGRLKAHLVNITGTELAVEMASSDTVPLADWCAAQTDDAVYLEFHSAMSGPSIWVRVSRLFLTGCVDCFFGGQFDGETCAQGKLTRSEIGMIDRLAKLLADSLSEGWSAVYETTVHYTRYIHDIDDLEMDLDDPNILVSSARVALSGHAVKAIDFVQPIDGLSVAEPQLHRPVNRETHTADPAWQKALKESFDHVFLPVRSVLARPTMDLSQLSQLAVGDILPVAPTDNVPLIVGDRVFAHGSIGEQNGGVAFKIKQFL
ncbi:FliM/FliN family flagellar motor switch protein [Parasphingorhabdus sp. JC815]|uniref:FliM/FliN family flagellar motor switch protein n=1 Tax=Parasphingorhabdus sp. JC815 TaxID=3232140 RepID=UPI00345AE757